MEELKAKTVETKKAICANCGGQRTCEIRGSAYTNDEDNDSGIWARTDWFVLQCRGCDYMFCQTVSIFSESYSYSYNEFSGEQEISHDETIAYWPAIAKRTTPNWLTPLGFPQDSSNRLYTALRELYVALDHDLFGLASAGIRTSFDIASELLGVEESLRFSEKLDELVSKSLINGVDRDRLEILTEAGSASMHRGWRPDVSDLDTMVEILEHFIRQAFILPVEQKRLDEKAKKLKGIVPPKKPRKKMSL